MDNHRSEKPDSSGSPDSRNQLAFIREETRFEIGLLHERVNALVGAEAFLTIAFTAAMSNGTAWGARFAAIVAPILSAPDQWRSMLFFRAAPGLFALVWTILTVVALVIHH